MLHLVKTFELGNTIYFEVIYRDQDGSFRDPNPGTPTWRIKNAKGVTMSSGIPLKRGTGIFYFFWTSPEEGDYLLEFGGIIDLNPVVIRRTFKIIKTRINKYA